MEPLKIGLIGGGMMAAEHLGNIIALEDATAVAVADPHPPSVANIQEIWQNHSQQEHSQQEQDELEQTSSQGERSAVAPLQVFDNHHDLIAADICDAVIISTPNLTHSPVLLDLLQTPLHILVEKPLCTTVENCLEVIDAAEASPHNSVVWVGMEYRYMAPVARLIAETTSGKLGKLQMVSIREHRFPFLPKVNNWNRFNRNTGGTLVEKCCHFFDLMDIIIGERPSRVYASGGQSVNHMDENYDGEVPDVMDHAYLVIDYPSGTKGMLDYCMFAEATNNQEEFSVVGDVGKMEAFVPEGIVRLGLRDRHWIGQVDTFPVHDNSITFHGGHHGSSYLEVEAFTRAVRNGTPPEVTLLDGLWSVATGVAGHKSIQEGRPIEMSEIIPMQL